MTARTTETTVTFTHAAIYNIFNGIDTLSAWPGRSGVATVAE